MASTGLTATATTSDAPVSLALSPTLDAERFYTLLIINTGTVAGWFSIDNGQSWNLLTAAVSGAAGGASIPNVSGAAQLFVKRTPSGSNVTGIYASML